MLSPTKLIPGKTTFQDTLDWGVQEEVIQLIIGDELPFLSTVLKDHVTHERMEFSSINTSLQVEVEKTK